MFNGAITDLVTPFSEGEVDLEAFSDLVEWQISEGSHGLLVASRTGEAPTLTMNEVTSLVQRCLDITAGRIPVMAAVGGVTIDDATEQATALLNLGIDALYLMLPAGTNSTTDGLYQHIRLIHDNITGPVILEHAPQYHSTAFDVDDLLRLCDLPRLIGVADHTTDITRLTTLRTQIGKPFALLCGNDVLSAAALGCGAHGCISATANAAPALCAALQNGWRNEELDMFENARDQLAPLHTALAREPAAITAKYALQRLGVCSDDVRLPLTPASAETRALIDKTLAPVGAFAASSAGIAA